MKRLAMALVTFIALFLNSGAASAQQDRHRYVRELYDQLDKRMADQGYVSRAFDPGLLQQDSSAFISLDLEQGSAYVLMGQCDDNCSDLNLVLYAADGSEAGHDTLPDNAPVVRVTPLRTGTYRLKITMAGCTGAQCSYGVHVYRK